MEQIPHSLEHPELLTERDRQAKMSEISILCEGYDDIFSDFDPRPFHERSLSFDFLSETKRASIEKEAGKIELKLLLPRIMRNPHDEVIIKKRLHEHFEKHSHLLNKEVREARKQGVLKALVGMILIIGAGILYTIETREFLANVLLALLEPAGWFTAWTGLEDVFYNYKTLKPDHDFYKKMATAKVTFWSY